MQKAYQLPAAQSAIENMKGDPQNTPCKKRRACAIGLAFFLGIALFFAIKYVARTVSARHQAAALRDRLAVKELQFPSYEEHGILPEAFVLLLSVRSGGGHMEFEGPTVGFTVGDGSHVLTAEHVVTTVTSPPSEATCQEDLVLSLHHGDLFPFDTVGKSSEHDVSLVRPHWPSHPALTLDIRRDLVSPMDFYVVGGCVVNTDFLQGSATARGLPTPLNKRIRMEKLSLLQGSSSRAANHAIALEDNRFILPGWSGSAIVDVASGRVTGLLTNHKVKGFWGMALSHYALGRNVAAIESVAGSEEVKRALRGVVSAAPRPPDAERCYTLFLQFYEHIGDRELPEAIETLKILRSLRPKSAPLARLLGYVAHAGAAEDPNQTGFKSLAEASFVDALSLAPQDPHAHAAFGRLLQEQGERNEALRHVSAALTADPNHPLAMWTSVTLKRDTDPNTVLHAASELVRRFPDQPLYWNHYSETLFNVGHYLEAKKAGEKAAGLDSVRSYRRPLARALAKLGQLDEAEGILERMTKQCGCQRCWYEYGSFLINYRKSDLDALAGAAQACGQISSAEKRDGMEQAQAELEQQIDAAWASLRREPGPGEGPLPQSDAKK
jgi:tetratricopeptide (TPR) repeat protein